MKTARLFILLLILLKSVTVYSQDTISRINSNCLPIELRSTNFYSNYNFALKADSLIVSGQMETTCGSWQSAIINRLQDTLIINFHENRCCATCLCMYDIRFGIKISITDTILRMNGVLYNISYLFTDIPIVDNDGSSIDAIYDSKSEILRVKLKTDKELKGFQIYDDFGRLQLTFSNDRSFVDMAEFKPGIYFIRFEMADGNKFRLRFIKN